MIAALLNFNEDDQSFFSHHNSEHHRAVAQAILNKQHISIPSYILNPMPKVSDKAGMEGWIEQHAELHSIINEILKLTNNELDSVDLTNKDERASWLQLHFNDHWQWGSTLGVDS
jgi:hypothetical protein